MAIRWYGLFYILGFIIAYYTLKKHAKQLELTAEQIDSVLTSLVVGVIAGARLGYVFFYNPGYYLTNPLEIIAVWKGGLSFHGGLLGALVAIAHFCKKNNYRFLRLTDAVTIPLAVALVFGRIANFMNGELYGRITTVPWAVKFPNVEGFRHPSQLYESFKNVVIAGILWKYQKNNPKEGRVTALFLILYAIFRSFIEFVREPEIFIGIFTMGQFLNLFVVIAGIYLWRKTR